MGVGSGPGRLDDGVLRIEAGEAKVQAGNAEASDGQGADGHDRIGHRQVAPEATHAPHVLLVVHAVNDRAGAQEQEGLEEGVGEEVEHGRLVGADAGGEEHVAELRTGRIGDHALDIVLGQSDRGGEEGRDRANDGDDVPGDRGDLEQGRQQADHVDAGGDHGGRVDQGRDGRRALHGVGQPGVQEELGRLAHGADEEEPAGQVDG